MGQVANGWMPPGRRSVAAVWCLALALAAIAWSAGVLDKPQTAMHDLQARVFAPQRAASGAVSYTHLTLPTKRIV